MLTLFEVGQRLVLLLRAREGIVTTGRHLEHAGEMGVTVTEFCMLIFAVF